MEGHVGGAGFESSIIDTDLAVFNGDAGQLDTEVKRLRVNACDAFGNGDAGQAGTACKRICPNACDTAADGDAGQAGTVVKHTRFNACDAVRDGDAGQAGTVSKRRHPNTCDAFGNGDAGQAGTALKRHPANGSDAVGDGDAGQAGTVDKRLVANTCDAVGDGDAGQAVTGGKRRTANGGNPIRYDHVSARALILHQCAVNDLEIIRAAVVRGGACRGRIGVHVVLQGIKRQVDAPDLRKRGIEEQSLAAFQDDSIPGIHVDIHIRGFDIQGFDIHFDLVHFRHRAGHNKRYDKQRGQQAYPHPFHSHCLQSEMIYRLQNTVTQ